VAGWFGLPVARVRLVVAALAVLTFGVAGVLYLAAWLLAPAGVRRRAPAALALVGLTAFGALGGYHQLATRGTVARGEDARPLAGADVVLIDGDHVAAWTRTDARGAFRFWHPPGGRIGRGLAICARGVRPFYQPTASSAVLRSEYGLGAYPRDLPRDHPRAVALVPAALHRVEGLPATCVRPAP
jgi:hypothetical protein